LGLDSSSVIFLCAAKSMGIDFSSTLMIGRQSFWPTSATLRRVFDVLGIDRDADEFLSRNEYSEEFFSMLGARQVESLDVSTYEKATILHDMNLTVPCELRERFTVVHDGGTIEHVFNIPEAIKNCMEMVRVGGHFIQVGVANNYTGHGFWQFSPELIFRVFSPQNGYRIEAVLMHEVIPEGAWYVVSDPDEIRRRVELCNSRPTYILTIAQRIASVEIFRELPHQSDYVNLWDRTLKPRPEPSAVSRDAGQAATWRSYIPEPVKRPIRSAIRRLAGYNSHKIQHGFSKSTYRRVRVEDLLRGRLPSRASITV
jgi:hypothetical protein